jgi:hypothetical protein
MVKFKVGLWVLGLLCVLWPARCAIGQAVRVRVDGVCGSGHACGTSSSGVFVLTNAHVAGTRVGRVVKVDATIDGRTVTVDGRIVASAYSDRTLTDWAVLLCPATLNVPIVKLSVSEPALEFPHQTCGSPRCVWPLVCQQITSVGLDRATGLWRWSPNSIGGQSGSGVVSRQGKCVGLVTWSWGGRGAGQTTAQIYKQSQTRSVDGPERVAGLVEVNDARSVTEVGYFSEAISDLPIWDAPGGGGGECDCNGPGWSELREAATRAGIDFAKLVSLILQIIQLFQGA